MLPLVLTYLLLVKGIAEFPNPPGQKQQGRVTAFELPATCSAAGARASQIWRMPGGRNPHLFNIESWLYRSNVPMLLSKQVTAKMSCFTCALIPQATMHHDADEIRHEVLVVDHSASRSCTDAGE